jgi:AcrR family transcriptional regulator
LTDAAARVFELKGYEGATVSQIASEAGVTTGAIYAHYESKAELLVDALREHSERVLGALLLAPGGPTAAVDILMALGVRLRDRKDDSGLLVEALLASRRDVELGRVLADALLEREATMAALIAGAQSQGELNSGVSAAAAARFALMLGLGSVLVTALDLPETDSTDWTEFMRQFIGAFTEGEQT